uniref:Ribosomal protein S4 n=1 Tax=Rhizaria sp. TaxID=2204297 RepID=A0A5P8DJS3_9EUKA|nr:ribosomal protein S4 [Rhizaria sp.]
MLNNTIVLKKKKIRKFVLRKLKKKWRFWRMFKFYFLRRKKKFFFSKLAFFFNQKRIIWHQLSVMYGKKIKNNVYVNHKSKIIFNSKFGNILCKLELRLNILILRLCFVKKLLESNCIIKEKKIRVNGLIKHKNYLVSTGDLIVYSEYFSKFKRKYFDKRRWNRFKWRKWKKKPIKKMFFLLKRNFIFNFMEINYSIFSSILLRQPLLGEITYRNKKQLLISSLLRKIYFLY